MTEKPTATFMIRCHGCQKSEIHSYTGNKEYEYKLNALVSKEGWIRREFSPSAKVWFCSSQCAFQSPAALQCELWWQKHRTNQNKEMSIWKTVALTAFTVAATLASAFGLQHLLGK